MPCAGKFSRYFFLFFFQTVVAWWIWDIGFSAPLLNLPLPSSYWVRKLRVAHMQFFRYSVSCPGTYRVQTFCLSSCNVWTIVAPPASCEKCLVISHCMPVINYIMIIIDKRSQFYLMLCPFALHTCHVCLFSHLGTSTVIAECL